MKKNTAFMGVSIDGYIADKNGQLDFLDIIPNDEKTDMGYYAFMKTVDAIVMGRHSFETVLSFDINWPYDKMVFVLSSTLKKVPAELENKVFIVQGEVNAVLKEIHSMGYESLYIDGGKTVQSFLQEDQIDEMIITTVPILIGGGTPLFGSLSQPLQFELVETQTFLRHVVQRHYRRKR